MKLIFKTIVIINCVALLSCSNESESEKANLLTNNTEQADFQVSREVLDNMMQSLPQPIEVAQIISASNVDISKSVLIPSDNADSYEDKYEQALAFGAFGVDLGYVNLNNKTLYMVEYLEGVKDLSEKLKVNQFFDFQTMAKLAKHKNNSDSLVQLSTENFNKIDQFLREQNRGELSVLILVGAWMEGMNMFGEIYKSTKSTEISRRIGEQKIVFDNVYLLLNKLNKIEFFNNMEKSLVPLRTAYDKIKVSYKYKKPIMQEVNGQLVLKDQTEMVVDFVEKDIADIVKELQSIRNKHFIIK